MLKIKKGKHHYITLAYLVTSMLFAILLKLELILIVPMSTHSPFPSISYYFYLYFQFRDGSTPLHYAIQSTCKEGAEILLKAGANPDFLNKAYFFSIFFNQF